MPVVISIHSIMPKPPSDDGDNDINDGYDEDVDLDFAWRG